MKAGIFEFFNGDLAYVAKDRSIKAGFGEGQKLMTYDKGERGWIETGGKTFDAKRVGGVPNGCTDHAQALEDFKMIRESESTIEMLEVEFVGNEPVATPENVARFNTVKPTKNSDDAVAVLDSLYPYQREAIKRFEDGGTSEPGLREGEVPLKIGKTIHQFVEDPNVKILGVSTSKGGLVALDFAEAEKLVEAYRQKHPDIYGVMADEIFKHDTGKTQTGRFIGSHPALGAPYKSRPKLAKQTLRHSSHAAFVKDLEFATHLNDMRASGWRPVHRQSARKHRRKGHDVQFAHGRYWWRAKA